MESTKHFSDRDRSTICRVPLFICKVNSLERLVFMAAFLLLCLSIQAQPAGPSAGSATAPIGSSGSVHQSDAGRKVQVSRVNGEFCQSGGSCVLASYAIVANYFTGQPIATYFEGYCKHFGLSYKDAREAEQKYAEHFDREWRKRDCRGYEVILDLHSNSTVKCFVEARQKFDGHFYLDSAAHLAELEDLLTSKEAFLNITYEPGQDYHSITVVHDNTGLMARDTNRKGLFPIPSLAKIGKLRDSVLYMGK